MIELKPVRSASLKFDLSNDTIMLTLLPYGKGPKGDKGDQGDPGVAAGYEHVQSGASLEWIINHNLGYNPIIEVLSPGGLSVLTEVQHLTLNQARVYFLTPQTGKAVAR